MRKILGKIFLLVVIGMILSSCTFSSAPFGVDANAQRTTPDNKENEPPRVTITYPTYCSDSLVKGDIVIQGTAYDEESGIKNVEVSVHPLPFGNEYQFESAQPISEGNWSQWSYSAHIPDDNKTYRILVHVIDTLGKENWDETLVNSDPIREIHEARYSSENDGKVLNRIGLVTPTFTSAAYNYDSFYFFYYRYSSIPEGVAITKDLNLMTGEIPRESEDAAIIESFASRIKEFSPESSVSIIKDENIHHGLLFANDGRNIYDALVMFHNEYVTQAEYDNLRKFVENGGTVIFMDPNVFYAEVKFDEDSCVVTLVKGHNWEFDGTAVRKGVWERYADENREWMGSNFINRDMANAVRFDNNPFGYTHFEENELLNPNGQVLLDYGAKFKLESSNYPLILGGLLKPDQYSDLGKRIATYELQTGKGKVIMVGLFGQNLVNNAAFTEFFDKLLLPRALGLKHEINIDGHNFEVYSKLQDGKVTRMVLDQESKSLIVNFDIDKVEQEGEKLLTISLPRTLIDARNAGGTSAGLTVFVDGEAVKYSESDDDIERGLALYVPRDATEVRIMGTQIAPEFSFTLPLFGILLTFIFVLVKYNHISWDKL